VHIALQTAHPPAAQAVSQSSKHLVSWLIGLGGIGLFLIAVVDSSVIPLPIPGSTDLVLLFLCAHRNTTASAVAALVAWAIAGSIVGGYLTWGAGRKGGTALLEKFIAAKRLKRVTGWVKGHGALSICVAALMPPPIPLLPFLLAAGALGVTRGRFLLAYSAARIVRYSLIGWLGYTYGRRLARILAKDLHGWSAPILWTFLALVLVGAAYGVWKFRRQHR
jgi:membrane protein DedA with SNARE-associated domain